MSETPADLSGADPHVVVESAEDTGGEYVRAETTLHPDPHGDAKADLPHRRWGIDNPFEHVHPSQEEHWEVLWGEFRVVFDGEERTLEEGDTVTIPRGTPHRHWNPTDEPARVAWERRPPLQTEAWVESVFALAQAGKTDDDGVPGLLHTAAIYEAYPEQLYPTAAPVWLQRLFGRLVGPLARLLGYEATHTREEVGYEATWAQDDGG